MLHMVVLTHGPETCAAADEKYGKMGRDGMSRREEAANRLGATIEGMWIDGPAHQAYFLIDAPDGHTVGRLMVALDFPLWNTVAIHPVILFEEAMKSAK